MSQEFFKTDTEQKRLIASKMGCRAMADCITCCASVGLLIAGAVLLSKYSDNTSSQNYITAAIMMSVGVCCFLSSCFDFCRHSAQMPTVSTDERANLSHSNV